MLEECIFAAGGPGRAALDRSATAHRFVAPAIMGSARMRLTVHTDYSLRLLIYLAAGRPDRLTTVDEVAVAYGISRDHVAKVAHRLGLEGYVATVRGRSGGLRLAHAPEAINIGALVRQVEPDLAVVPCMAPLNAPCRIGQCCVLRQAMQRARGAFLETLDEYSLADFVRPRAALAAALGLPPPARRRADG
jgi:Rrf2 family transcriptional regulator, nitric oxide-sensitive transcriptional repressor